MNALPNTPAFRAVAQRVVWFKTPDQSLADARHFLSHVMTYGTPEDLAALRHVVSRDDFRDALDHAPPGVFDERSWAYWNFVIAGRAPPPPLPSREGRFPR